MGPRGIKCLRTLSEVHLAAGLTPTKGSVPVDLAGRLYRIGPGRFEDERGRFPHWCPGVDEVGECDGVRPHIGVAVDEFHEDAVDQVEAWVEMAVVDGGQRGAVLQRGGAYLATEATFIGDVTAHEAGGVAADGGGVVGVGVTVPALWIANGEGGVDLDMAARTASALPMTKAL